MKPYDALSEVQKQLLFNDFVDLVGTVDRDMLAYVREVIVRAMAQPGVKQDIWPELLFLLTTNGGSISAGLDIYDIIRSYPGNTVGRVLCGASSMGAVILQACKLRQCLSHANVLIHNPHLDHLTWDEKEDPKKLQKRFSDLDQERLRMLTIWSERSGQPFEKVAALCAEDEDLNAEQALGLGLIDEIYEPNKKEPVND